MSLKIERRPGGIFLLAGSIDGGTDLTIMAADAGPIIIDFGAVSMVNSRGVARVLELAHALHGRQVTYQRCVAPLVDAFMTVPAMLGRPPSVARISSLVVPYKCPRCYGVYEEALVEEKELKLEGSTLTFPVKICSKCGLAMAVEDAVINDYDDLVASGALKPRAA